MRYVEDAKFGQSSIPRIVCWVEAACLAFGMPAAVWLSTHLFPALMPSVAQGHDGTRFLFWIMQGAIVEWLFVFAAWAIVRRRGNSFRQLGVWRGGNVGAWALALAVAAISISSNLRFLPRMHLPISSAFVPHGFHLAAALLMGITAGFCEEALFRAFLMTEFEKAGYGKTVQIFVSGIAFGLSHAAYLNMGFIPWLGIVVPVALIGMCWGAAYLIGRRSLLPSLVAHFLNDATALPWIMFFMIIRR